eukprot:3332076-Alexandrium_andersonii.AAC.1
MEPIPQAGHHGRLHRASTHKSDYGRGRPPRSHLRGDERVPRVLRSLARRACGTGRARASRAGSA